MNKRKFKLFKFLIIIVISAAAFITMVNSPSLAQKDKPDWGYGGASNPTKWDELSQEFQACKLGRDQSPISIDSVEEYGENKIEFNYMSSSAEVVDNGSTIQVDLEPGNSIKIDGSEYKLVQFHFHTPGEHQIENEAAAMELHLVHQNEAEKLAVVGLMMNAGADNPIIASVWDAIPTAEKATQSGQITIDLAGLLPEDKTFISYPGSLTTPPCKQQVKWNLLLEPIELSSEQIETFESFYPYNARPIQPLNGRTPTLHQQ